MERPLPFIPARIEQRDVEAILSFDAQIANLKSMRNEKVLEILGQLRAGARVEAGRHSLEVRQQERGASEVRLLAIDGKVIR